MTKPTIYESTSATCYGFTENKKRKIVTVVAQWTENGEFWLIQLTNKGNEALGWRGRVYEPPIEPKARAYFCSVFNLIAHKGTRQPTVEYCPF